MSQKQRKGTRISATQDNKGLKANIEQIEEQEYALFPSPEFLKQLNEINPDYVAQILQDYRDEKSHRHQLENQKFAETTRLNTQMIAIDNRQLDLMSRGQWFGLVLAVGLLIISGFAIYKDQPWVAGTAISAIIGILVVYVLRQRPNAPQT